MRFEQIQPGMVIDGGRRTVTEAEIIEFAKRYDPQLFHVDPVRAREQPLERPDFQRLDDVLDRDGAGGQERAG